MKRQAWLVTLIFWLIAPLPGYAQVPALPVTVVVATDLHELAPLLHDDAKAYRRFAASGAGRDIFHTEDILDAFERDLAADRPRWLILTGDLTNNGERESHRALAVRLARIEALGTQVLVIPGNHDVNNPWARRFEGDRQMVTDGVSPGDFASIYRDFGYASGVRDPNSLSYRIEAAPGLWFLMLDTARYLTNLKAGQPTTGGVLGLQTLAWVRSQAAEARRAGARIVVAQHHSLFDHSDVIKQGFTLDNGPEVAQLYAELGIRLVLSGHIHIQDAVAQTLSGARVYDIATNALSVYPNQYGRLSLDAKSGRARYRTTEVDVEGWARATGKTDPALLSYEAWSANSFAEAAGRLVRQGLDGLDPATQALASDTMALLNQRYFAGREGLNKDLVDSPGFLALANADLGRLTDYAQSIVADDETDDNLLEFFF